MSTVVVGYDGSEASKNALRWAAAFAVDAGASLEVVHAYEQHAPGEFFEEQAVRQVVEDVTDLSSTELDTRVIVGEDPRAALVERSREARLLVVGSRGLSGLKGLMLGSVSQYCVSHAHCPVTVVR